MIFSVQNNNLTFSVEFSADLVQIQVRETVCGVFLVRMDIPIQVWHMVEVMRRDFNEHHTTEVTSYRESTWRNANDGGSGRACRNELPRNS